MTKNKPRKSSCYNIDSPTQELWTAIESASSTAEGLSDVVDTPSEGMNSTKKKKYQFSSFQCESNDYDQDRMTISNRYIGTYSNGSFRNAVGKYNLPKSTKTVEEIITPRNFCAESITG